MRIETEPTAEIRPVLEKIAEIRPLLLKNGAQGEADRRVPEESIEALNDTGAFLVSTPKKFGGLGLGHRAALDVGREVARGDGGTAWVVSLLNSGAWYTSRYGEQAQEDIFGTDPNARVSVVVAPSGTATKVEGGYRISGKWFYNSGSWHATWALIAVQLKDENGEALGEGQLLVPSSDFWIDDVWYVAGMRSSGSNCLVVEDAFVPEYRVLTAASNPNPAPYNAVSVPLALLGPQLGLGRAVLDAVLEGAPRKSVTYTTIGKQSESVAVQLLIAQAAQMLDTADLFAYRAAANMDYTIENGHLDYTTRAQVRADIGWAVENVAKAIEMLMSAHGSSSFAESNPIQRFWRDQAVVARHGYVLPHQTYEAYGKALLGVEDTVTTWL